MGEDYQTRMREYRGFLATAQHQEALKSPDAAIICRPCDECLATLTMYRRELEPKTRKFSARGMWAAIRGIE
jgi:hypothetical protein